MSTPHHQNASENTPSSSKEVLNTPASSARGRIILLSDQTPIRPAKRGRTAASSTPRRTSARLASNSSSPKKKTPTRQKAKRGARNGVVSSRADADEDEDDGASSSDEELVSTIKKQSENALFGKSFIHRSAFDAYFAAASKPSRTSNNVFSQLVPPLAQEDYTRLLHDSAATSKNAAEIEQVLKGHETLFPRYALELAEGFNLLFFGFGSKRDVINTFARTVCAKRGHLAVVNGYMPHVGIKDVLGSIEQVPGLTDVSLGSPGLEAQTRRIYDFFLPPAVRPSHPTSAHPLFLVIHNIDSPGLRAPKAKAALSLLALNPRIHIIASVDHVHAQMVWSTAEASARKHSYGDASTGSSIPPTRGFAWAWHDMTTMCPYDAELAHVDLNRVGKPTGKGVAAGAGTERAMTETAAQHILASVNTKAKKLFALLANTLLASLEESGTKSPQKQHLMQRHAVSYDALFNAARTDFIATNDTSFKALLAEFRDHKLVVSNVGGGGETLWIPLKVEELRRLTSNLIAD